MASSIALPFNTPLESALRALVLLVSARPGELDLQRLVTLDYFVVHTEDVGGPPSLHPATPNRAGEILVRRSSMRLGVEALVRKGLARIEYGSSGVVYSVTQAGEAFWSYFQSDYSKEIDLRGRWVNDTFGRLTDKELRGVVESNLGRWGAEFAVEPGLEEEADAQ